MRGADRHLQRQSIRQTSNGVRTNFGRWPESPWSKRNLSFWLGGTTGGFTPKSRSRFADSAPGANAPKATTLMNAYSPGFSDPFGTTLYTPGSSSVDVNVTLALSSVPEDAPKREAGFSSLSLKLLDRFRELALAGIAVAFELPTCASCSSLRNSCSTWNCSSSLARLNLTPIPFLACPRVSLARLAPI